MVTEIVEKEDSGMLRKEAEKLVTIRKENAQKKADARLGKSGADLAGMSDTDIEKLLFEFQVHQIELELQNEELKRTHQELSVSHDDFARIYNLSPIAYLTINEQGLIKKANIAATQLLSRSEEPLVGKRLGKFIHPSDQDNYYFFMRDLVVDKNKHILNAKLVVKNSEVTTSECPGFGLYGCSRALCSHNSDLVYVELRSTVNNNYANDSQIYLTIQDVTGYKYTQATISCLNKKLEQKIFEQTSKLIESNQELTQKIEELNYSKHQLWEREAKLTAIFDASIEGIITIDTFGVILSTNKAVETIFGYSEQELVGCSFDKLMSPLQKKNQRQNVTANIPGVIGLTREIDGLCKDGSIVPLDVSLVEYAIDGAKYFTGIFRDVSLRKHQEQQEKEHLEELAHVTRVGLMGEMGSGIAHEVNQPLTAITNYTQACLRFIGAENPDLVQLGDILFKIHQQALKAGQIIHRMKNFVSPRKICRTSVDINTLVEDAVSLSANAFKQSKIKLELDLEKNLPEVTIDDVQIEQVLLNLIRNSIDALKDMPSTTQRKIKVHTRLKNINEIEVKVNDNGSGIDEAQKDKILNPFFTTKSTGMGMGLSISRSIIDAHEGIFNFKSKPEKGTTFYFTLPIKRKYNEQ
ncbi:PAS domain-containing sensor histidine kinase [Methylobacter psychrophilus]|uniref:PAS domain-containing sensor histidine kinase n=1 Tax=Methylobacter psychrophilus TaxID=96941 RepID=UPI0021D4D185|nr:PAS domain S-box protein [Methylobacter psychrophilus]